MAHVFFSEKLLETLEQTKTILDSASTKWMTEKKFSARSNATMSEDYERDSPLEIIFEGNFSNLFGINHSHFLDSGKNISE